jgi:hypothetical protein
MDWRTPTDAEVAALVAARIDAGRRGAGILVGAIDDDGRRGVAA